MIFLVLYKKYDKFKNYFNANKILLLMKSKERNWSASHLAPNGGGNLCSDWDLRLSNGKGKTVKVDFMELSICWRIRLA